MLQVLQAAGGLTGGGEMSTKHAPTPWLRDGRLIYSLEPSGYRKGKEVFENRFSTYVEAGRNTTLAEAEATAEFIQRACNCHDELVAALQTVWAMFDDGRIVRNINNDGKPDWAMKMLEFTRELQKIQSAIAKATTGGENK